MKSETLYFVLMLVLGFGFVVAATVVFVRRCLRREGALKGRVADWIRDVCDALFGIG
jgi:hypothetical protein